MDSILDWNTKEGNIFRGGSGSGINLSNIRGSMEPLAKGGTASGPVSFMRGADSWAGTIKSGGKTRRAAKMVVLDVDHPDIREFIWCKAKEEDKAAALRDAGFDMSIDGDGFHSIQYQNANNCVRVTDEFMHAVEDDADWHLIARTTGEPVGEPIKARELMREIAEAAWRCADPGVQYDTTINQWHTSPNSGRINASNPCSEYMHVDDSACNLASINLMKFRRPDGSFDVESFQHTVDIVLLAQEIVVSPSSYPTKEIGDNARAFRQLGLGYANLGAFLMANGFAYDSDEGRGAAAAITALMTGRAYAQSAKIAAAMGPYDRYAENREAHNNVMRMHRDASYAIPDSACRGQRRCSPPRARRGTRPSRSASSTATATRRRRVLAPTGTISFLMDCDTTGIEPDFSLVKYKELVGGGNMVIANRTVPMALRTLGYGEAEVEQIEAYVAEHGNDRRRARPAGRAPVGVRRRGRRARDLARRPHQDDGRGPAVPLGRDLQDGQHAADRDGRGHRGGLHRGLEARRQGAGDLPRRLEDRPGAAHRRAGGQGGQRQGRGRAVGGRGDLHAVRGRRADHGRGREGARCGPRRARTSRCASACRASATRSRTSSRSAATRATSPPACTTTAPSARSS